VPCRAPVGTDPRPEETFDRGESNEARRFRAGKYTASLEWGRGIDLMLFSDNYSSRLTTIIIPDSQLDLRYTDVLGVLTTNEESRMISDRQARKVLET